MLRVGMAALLALFVVPAASASHPLRTGLYLAQTAADSDALSFERAANAGTSIVRLRVQWSTVAPAAPPDGFDAANPDDPAYDWSAIDAEVALADEQHLQALLTVYDAPSWAESGSGDRSTGGAGVSASAFAAFATAIATRFDGSHGHPRVRYWEAWNEPNVNVYLTPQFSQGQPASPAAYRQLLNAFADAVHSVHPGNLVIAGAQSPFTVRTGSTVTIGPLSFMRSLLCMSAGAHPRPTCHTRVDFDVWSHHPYTSGNATHHALNPNDVSLGDLPKMHALLDAAYAAGHIVSAGPPGFWVTEFSWDSSPPDPKGVPIPLHARWTAEALYRMWLAGVDVAIWLQLYDGPFPATSAQGGLYFYPGPSDAIARPKPALTAFTFPFVAYLASGGVSVWTRTPGGKPGTVVVERKVGAGWRRLAVLRSDRFGIVQKTITGTFTGKDWLRARFGAVHSLPFSLTQPPDRFLDPFGT